MLNYNQDKLNYGVLEMKKNKKGFQVSVYVDEETLNKIEVAAKENERNKSDMVRLIIKRYFAGLEHNRI